MGRRRKSLFPIIKVNARTVFNIFGFLLIGIGIITLLSFIHLFQPASADGRLLSSINQELVALFGGLAILTPFMIIFMAGHFFNTKKLKFIRLNITVGIGLVFIALLGLLRSGTAGQLIADNLTSDFSRFGELVILIMALIIGLILFLDTSVDIFFLFILRLIFVIVKTISTIFKFTDRKLKKDFLNRPNTKDTVFIKDKQTNEKVKPLPVITPAVIPVQQAKPVKNFSAKPPASSSSSTWVYPPISLLQEVSQKEADRGDVQFNADTIEKTLDSFGIRARVAEVNPGPTVTQYAIEITRGTKLSKITALANDLALALAAPTGQVRIEAPIPGRSLVGIEIPNKKSEIVTLKRLLTSDVFVDKIDPLLLPLGLDVAGKPQVVSIPKMPHVLIAGTTGSGKSVLLNAWIATLLMRTRPDELQMILVDPKQVELTQYNGIPHLLNEVIVDSGKVVSALRWACREMENRYHVLASAGARNLEGYNAIPGVEKKPYILFIIDELADLMMFAANEAEDLITRLAQKARAVGIHLLLSTQRPSVDVITGLMKANIPCRIAFNVSSMIDSRVIIDSPGAEKLLGRGDMFFLPPDQAKPKRIQGPFITEKEVSEIVKFLKAQVPVVHYTEEIVQQISPFIEGRAVSNGESSDERDPLFDQAVNIISQFDKASASLLQRRLKLGYSRAARILDQLEVAGYVGPAEGSKPREVLKRQPSSAQTNDEVL